MWQEGVSLPSQGRGNAHPSASCLSGHPQPVPLAALGQGPAQVLPPPPTSTSLHWGDPPPSQKCCFCLSAKCRVMFFKLKRRREKVLMTLILWKLLIPTSHGQLTIICYSANHTQLRPLSRQKKQFSSKLSTSLTVCVETNTNISPPNFCFLTLTITLFLGPFHITHSAFILFPIRLGPPLALPRPHFIWSISKWGLPYFFIQCHKRFFVSSENTLTKNIWHCHGSIRSMTQTFYSLLIHSWVFFQYDFLLKNS